MPIKGVFTWVVYVELRLGKNRGVPPTCVQSVRFSGARKGEVAGLSPLRTGRKTCGMYVRGWCLICSGGVIRVNAAIGAA